MRPLEGIRIVELVGIGPGPFAAMVLADLGADVIRIARAESSGRSVPAYDPRADLMNRGRRSIAVNLKDAAGVEAVLSLVERADALIEPYRPGVMERLGLGPDTCLERNERLVYARMTGWGQEGPYAAKAGHDINYLALNGVLSLIGREGDRPVPPLNLVGDFGGGALFLVLGLLAGVINARATGVGQTIDVAMVDGSALLATVVHTLRAMGDSWGSRGTNMLDTGAPFYEVYETADGKFISVGSIEPQFYRHLLEGLDLHDELATLMATQHDRSTWRPLKERFVTIFARRTRAEWVDTFDARDACVAPVLSMDEAIVHPHNTDRNLYREYAGYVQPAPAPRFSGTPADVIGPPPRPAEHTREILEDWGLDKGRIDEFVDSGAVQIEMD